MCRSLYPLHPTAAFAQQESSASVQTQVRIYFFNVAGCGRYQRAFHAANVGAGSLWHRKRPKPRGVDFTKLLPATVGPFKRGTVMPPKGGEDGSVIYQHGITKIYMQFGRSQSQEEVQTSFRLIVSGATSNGRVKPRILVTGRDPSYVKIVDEQSAFFGWTRGLYHFTVDTKLEKDMDAFMTLFPY